MPKEIKEMTSGDEDASLPDGMSSGLVRLLQDNLQSLRDDLRDDIREVKSDVKEMASDLGELKDELTGKDGVRERLFALETEVKALKKKTSSVYPPSKPGIKEHATTAGIGAGAGGAAIAIFEFVQQIMKLK